MGRNEIPGKWPLKIAQDLCICLALGSQPQMLQGLAGDVEEWKGCDDLPRAPGLYSSNWMSICTLNISVRSALPLHSKHALSFARVKALELWLQVISEHSRLIHLERKQPRHTSYAKEKKNLTPVFQKFERLLTLSKKGCLQYERDRKMGAPSWGPHMAPQDSPSY